MQVFLGVDGGNSGTRALAIDSAATVLGYGTGGNANHQGCGIAPAIESVATAVHTACHNAGLSLNHVQNAFFALAGDDTDDDQVLLEAALSALWPDLSFNLENDVWAGLRAGAVTGCGVAVNCGSGTGVVGRAANGEKAIIPDIGYEYGDSGGGSQIAADALHAVSRAADGRGSATALTALVLATTCQPDVEALRRALRRDEISRETTRRLTPLVFAAAAAQDEVALAILQHIGDELGVSGAAIARRLHLQNDAFTLVLTGGAFRSLSSSLATAMIARVRRDAPRCIPTLPLVMPVAGAALLALDAAQCTVTTDHYARLQAQGYSWYPEEQSSSPRKEE